jgi:hypothetical protein
VKRALFTVVATAALVLPGTAIAGVDQESIIQDDHLLLARGADVRNRTLDDIRTLGADTIRALVHWRNVAPKPNAKRRPKFDATDPAAYPATKWDPYDDLVRGATSRGIAILFSPASPIPNWGSGCKGGTQKRRACRPRSAHFARFVKALGRRYDGTYADENQGGGVLPRVSQWSIWNEPNIPGWLEPQFVRRGGKATPYASQMYRNLARKGFVALERTGHAITEFRLGETAPIGRTTGPLADRPIPPRTFIASLFCMTTSGKRLRGAAARRQGCSRATRFAMGGFAHHPYTRGGSQPPNTRGSAKLEITIASIGRLERLLDAAARLGRAPDDTPIYYTEYGFQTFPPDKLFGVTLAEQSRFINESDWMAWKNARVRSVAQYKIVDEPNVANFQTGLRFIDDRTKPAYQAYRLPIWVVRGDGEVGVYGQIRPAAPNASEEVLIQRSDDEDGPFITVGRFDVTSLRGHFTAVAQGAGGFWRARWIPAGGGAAVTSRVAQPATR